MQCFYLRKPALFILISLCIHDKITGENSYNYVENDCNGSYPYGDLNTPCVSCMADGYKRSR